MWSTLICCDFHGPLQNFRKGGCHSCCRLWDGFRAPIANFLLSLLDVQAGVCQVRIPLDYQGRQWLADSSSRAPWWRRRWDSRYPIHQGEAGKRKQSPHILTRSWVCRSQMARMTCRFPTPRVEDGRQITSDTSHKHRYQPVDKRVRKCRKRIMWLRLSNLRQLGELLIMSPGDDSVFQVPWCKQCRSQWSSDREQTATFRGDLYTCASKKIFFGQAWGAPLWQPTRFFRRYRVVAETWTNPSRFLIYARIASLTWTNPSRFLIYARIAS